MTPKNKTPLLSEYYEIETKSGTLHIHIDYDATGPKRIFSQIPPIGSEVANNTAFIGIMLTKYFKAGGRPKDILKHLFSVKGTPIGIWDGQPIESIQHAIGIALKAHLETHTAAPASEPAPLTT